MPQTKTESQVEANNEEPRIEPIENPDSLKLKLAYWFTRRQMGKVVTPLKVVQARLPDTLSLTQKLVKIEHNLSIPEDLVFYIKSYVATLNGCSFCIDIAKANAQEEVEIEKYEELLNFESSNAFSKAEKMALKYVDQVTRQVEVSDEVFNELRRHFSENEIVEITWLNAVENYYNLINRPLQIESDNLCNV